MTGNYEIFISETRAVCIFREVASRSGALMHLIREEDLVAVVLLNPARKYVKSRRFSAFWESNDGKDYLMVLASAVDSRSSIIYPGRYYPFVGSPILRRARKDLEARLWRGGCWKVPSYRHSDASTYFKWTFVELVLLESWRRGEVGLGDPDVRYFEPTPEIV